MGPRAAQLAFAAATWVPALAIGGLYVACNGDEEGDGSTPSAEELSIENLGTQAIDDTGGYIDVDVTVPDGAISTLAWCGDWGDSALGAVWAITNPAGTQVYSGDAPDAGGFRSDFLDDLAPGLLPTTPELVPTPGVWHFQWFVGKDHDGDATCGAVHRIEDAVPANGTIHLDFVFVGTRGGLTAANASADPGWQQVEAEVTAGWSGLGLTPTFGYDDFTGDVGRFEVVNVSGDDYSEFNDLLRTANPASPRTMTIFLVEEIADAAGATILGLSGGPPGAAAVNGTSKSGVIVTTADLATAPVDVGRIIAHEGGHFLGLFHTTEKDGSRFDPLGDTPECPPSNDLVDNGGDGNGTMNSAECGGKGAENLMWWTLTEQTGTGTGNQGFVTRSNPIAD